MSEQRWKQLMEEAKIARTGDYVDRGVLWAADTIVTLQTENECLAKSCSAAAEKCDTLQAENAALQKDNDNLREAAQAVVDTIGSWMPRKDEFHYNQFDDDVMKALETELETELSTHESNDDALEHLMNKWGS